MQEGVAFVGVFGLGLALSLLLTRAAVWLGLRFHIADVPGGRRRHIRITSRLGVVPLFGAFTLAALASRTVFALPSLDPNEPTRLAGFLLGGGVMFVVAMLDDVRNLPARAQLLGQSLAAGVAISSQVFIERFTNPFTRQEVVLPQVLGEWAGAMAVIVLSLFWFLGMTNTVNLLDGVDGLAASVGVVACAVTAVHMVREGQHSVALLPLAMIGVLLGVLAYNRPPARIFLGGGALYLGYALACIGIIGGAKIALLMLVMGVPIADVLWRIVDRVRERRSPVSADRGHLHLRLIDRGWSAQRVVLLYVSISAAMGGMALLPVAPLVKLAGIGAVFTAVALGLRRLSHAPAPSAERV
ncbi:MAG: undecaprenyl/decaprenyl-phosphate alpha-N-acetylglucosaminyl 1-phosphate transferase [Thermoflexales bacterium]|nr:undecaprenyl/decaprenyl-phosphate alpha-N-acetylglucosaminyl 1-phosphate transferase [Thermoflexales bacterium]